MDPYILSFGYRCFIPPGKCFEDVKRKIVPLMEFENDIFSPS